MSDPSSLTPEELAERVQYFIRSRKIWRDKAWAAEARADALAEALELYARPFKGGKIARDALARYRGEK